MRPLGDELYI